MIKNCLLKVVSLGLNSIAFPTAGCGNLNYPSEKVAEIFNDIAETNTNVKVFIYCHRRMILLVPMGIKH